MSTIDKMPLRDGAELTMEGIDSLLRPPAATAEEERQRRKEGVVAALRMLAHMGMNDGAAGHITARDPEHLDWFWVNPVIKSFAKVRVSDLLLVDDRGVVVEGNGPLNKAAFAIHSRVHEARPDVVAAAHAHSTYGKIWSTTGRPLDPLTQDACAFYGSHGVYADFRGVVLDTTEGDRVGAALGTGKAVILRNHGLLTVGSTVEEAAWWFIAMEQACHVQVMAESIGTPLLIDPEMATLTAAQVGGATGAKLQFDCVWEAIRDENEDYRL
jgi:ribulose-5-phosphate 4-epimerase/fuculose-1-phosphate aldolase